MPQIELSSSTGLLNCNYTISTPTSLSSTTIDTHLPCILFIHAEYLSHEVFEAQFADPLLRTRFNLIGIDLRGYGHTTTLAKEGYTPAVAADDLYRFLNALKIPTIHLFAVSIGCHIALELVLAHPEVVSSLTLCTVPPAQEPPEVLVGRQEVFDFWNDSGPHQGGTTTEEDEDLDEDLVMTLVRGIQTMLFGDSTDPLLTALIGYGTTLAKIVWAGSPEALTSAYVVLIDWFARRRIFDVATLSKIKCSVSVIHCEDGIAYALHKSEEFVDMLRDAKVDVKFHQVSGPHFGFVTNPELINPIICERVLSVVAPNSPLPPNEVNAAKRQVMDTPFKDCFVKFGYRSEDDVDVDEDLDM
ncbi:hypothetical protein DXG01_001843 [Tephrocybe rancida]|nr:hypothetical protein DXG01_001843 [Tephrocybe rancida]